MMQELQELERLSSEALLEIASSYAAVGPETRVQAVRLLEKRREIKVVRAVGIPLDHKCKSAEETNAS